MTSGIASPDDEAGAARGSRSPAARERFLALDGLRGIAAIGVYAFHFVERPHWLAPYGYMAVDFFFVLSGFVIAYAYEERLRRPGAIGGFVRDRVIRLHPLLVLGAIPGAIMMLGSGTNYPLPWLTALTALVPMPSPAKVGLPVLAFPLNPPSWSLFWEVVMNLAFAFATPWLRTRVLVAFVAIALAAQIAATLAWGNLSGLYWYAGLRAMSCFPLGVLLLRIHRSGWVRWGRFGVYAAPLLVLCLFLPDYPHLPDLSVRLREAIVAFVVFPLIVLAAAGREARFPRTSAWLGGYSYPLYVLHMPVGYVLAGMPGGLPLRIALTLVLIWLIWRWYDEPVRSWLRRRLGRGALAA